MTFDTKRESQKVSAIVTVPPYAPFAAEVASHPRVSGLRLNTVMPIEHDDPAPVLTRLRSFGVPLWVDLKGRQLRVVGAAIPPFTEVRVSHRLHVRAGALAYFADGRECARIAAVDGDRIILDDGPRRLIGPGESVNIPDSSLTVEGTLTAMDRAWLDAMRSAGERHVMLSYTERASDVDEVRSALPGAEIVLKIETRRGLDLALEHGAALGRLMAARGDLFVEVRRPHHIVGAMRDVIRADPNAIAASRLFPSLARSATPDSPDLGDLAFLLSLGYRTFLLGDEVCLRRESVLAALELLAAVAEEVL